MTDILWVPVALVSSFALGVAVGWWVFRWREKLPTAEEWEQEHFPPVVHRWELCGTGAPNLPQGVIAVCLVCGKMTKQRGLAISAEACSGIHGVFTPEKGEVHGA